MNATARASTWVCASTAVCVQTAVCGHRNKLQCMLYLSTHTHHLSSVICRDMLSSSVISDNVCTITVGNRVYYRMVLFLHTFSCFLLWCLCVCCQDDTALDGDDCNGDDGGYYILVRRAEELMPPSCLFDKLDRAEADRCVCVGVCLPLCTVHATHR